MEIDNGVFRINLIELKKMQLETMEMQIHVMGYTAQITAAGEVVKHTQFHGGVNPVGVSVKTIGKESLRIISKNRELGAQDELVNGIFDASGSGFFIDKDVA